METVELVLVMLVAVAASGYLARVLPFSLPLPLVQIALGALITGWFHHGLPLEPEVFFLLFLPPLLFMDGWRIPNDRLLHDRRAILQLAFGLVLFTVAGAGFLIHWMIPAMPLALAFALAAILSPTDPVAVSTVAARSPIPKRLMHILEGESLLNDATGLVCFRFAVAAALSGHFSPGAAALSFLWLALMGLAIGVGVTLAVGAAQHWLLRHVGEESGPPVLISLLIPFGAYLLAEAVHASGILAAVAAGVTMSYVELHGRALATTRVQGTAVWNTMQFTLNGMIFVLLGEQLPDTLQSALHPVAQHGYLSRGWLAACAFAITLGLVLLRLVWVWISLHRTLLRSRHRGGEPPRPPARLLLATSFAGVRGAVTLAGVLTLPLALPDGTPLPARDLAVFVATAVILLSLLLASLGLPPLLKGLRLPEEPADERDEDRARAAAAEAAIAAIEQAQRNVPRDAADAEQHSEVSARLLALYRRRLDGAAASGDDAARLRRDEQIWRRLITTALQAEREAIFKLARQARISDEISRKLVREIDLIDARYR